MFSKIQINIWWVGFLLVATCGFASEPSPSTGGDEPPPSLSWLGPDGEALPFTGHEEALDFLRRARVVSHRVLSGGSTGPLKVVLEHRKVQAHAIFRHVDVRRQQVKVDGVVYRNFHDSYIYECAAYELSRWLGIDNVPPCIVRQVGDRQGTLQLWVEEAMTEADRRQRQHQAPEPMRWAREKQTLRLFDVLIANIDRNQGNMLLDSQGKLWFIDHTRSFGSRVDPAGIDKIVWCDQGLWSRLQELDSEVLSRRLEPFLSRDQLRSLRARGQQIRQHIEQRIQDLGSGAVLFDLNAPKAGLADSETVESDDDFPVDTALPDLGS